MPENLFFHKGEGRSHLVGIHVAIDKRDHHGSAYSVLVESAEQGVVEVRMVGFDAVVKHSLTKGY